MRNSQVVLACLFDGSAHTGAELLELVARNTNPADAVRAYQLQPSVANLSAADLIEVGLTRMLRTILNRFLRDGWVDIADYDSDDVEDWWVGLNHFGFEGIKQNEKVRHAVFSALSDLWVRDQVAITVNHE